VQFNDPSQVAVRRGTTVILPARGQAKPAKEEAELESGTVPIRKDGTRLRYSVRVERSVAGELILEWEPDGEIHPLVPLPTYQGTMWRAGFPLGDDDFADGCTRSPSEESTQEENGGKTLRKTDFGPRTCWFTSAAFRARPMAQLPICVQLLPQTLRGTLVGYSRLVHPGPCHGPDSRRNWSPLLTIEVTLETPWSNLAQVSQELHQEIYQVQPEAVQKRVLYPEPRRTLDDGQR
jgi:hypothetical protein